MLITARDRAWLDHAVAAATGNASSTILCDCEAGLGSLRRAGRRRIVRHARRPAAARSCNSTCRGFAKIASKRWSGRCWCGISQNVLTCPTTACFNLLDTEAYFKLGRKLAFFGDGYQFRDVRHGPAGVGRADPRRRVRHRSPLRLSRWADGRQPVVLGRRSKTRALQAAERGAAAAAAASPGVIMPFPGGIAASGSKAGSRYSFTIASTFDDICPTLRDKLGDRSRLPPGVGSVMEIIINGRDLPAICQATQAAIEASVDTPGLVKISAGNYGGRLGKSFIYLHPERQPA